MYCTIAQVKAKLGTFTSLIIGELTDDNIKSYIADSDALIDGYIASAVSLPFVSVPKLITAISIDLTVRNLWALRQAKDLPEHVKFDYDNALKLLNLINKGSLKLSADNPSNPSFNDLKFTAANRIFGSEL